MAESAVMYTVGSQLIRTGQGDANLKSEQGWQLDASYHLKMCIRDRANHWEIKFIFHFSNFLNGTLINIWKLRPGSGISTFL